MKGDDDWFTLFGFDSRAVGTGVNFGLCPAFSHEFVRDEGEHHVFRDELGVLQRARKDGTSMSEWLDYPVKDRETWEKVKPRFDPDSPERFPKDWDARARDLRNSPEIVSVYFYPFGFLGGPRTLMGAEGCLIAMAEEPELIEDINETLCNLWMKLVERICSEARVDEISAWEDMAGKNGSLISPAYFRRFLAPYYRRIMDYGRAHGVSMGSVDSDGFMHGLTPLFIECGLNCIFPYEVQAANDVPYLLRKHPDLCAFGHIDKRAMIRGRETIDAEIERIKPIVGMGRFIPHLDHAIPPDVSWESYQYMVWRWKELTGKKN